MKKLIYTTFGALLIALAVSGCNTMRGVGRDVSSAGSGIQRAANN
ncbi:MAG: entericidin A/B family lipoprotein [Chthoniobacteraceae bacterium]